MFYVTNVLYLQSISIRLIKMVFTLLLNKNGVIKDIASANTFLAKI